LNFIASESGRLSELVSEADGLGIFAEINKFPDGILHLAYGTSVTTV
jgi:hypothetical protein